MRKIKRIHFIGIGGTGMNGIAEVLLNQEYDVSGSDLSENAAVKHLKKLGAKIFIGHAESNCDGADVVVTSTAVKETNPEVIAARKSKTPVIPRAEMLAELMRFRHGIAVAGTHGKTTTTSLVASILGQAKLDPTYVIGGRLNSSGSNAKLGESKYIVAEADESDASFLFLQPMIAVVTNIDMEHMETYGGDINQLYKTFIDFLHHLPFYGLAIMCVDDAGVNKVISKVTRPMVSYGFADSADVYATDIEHVGMKTKFTVKRKDKADLNVVMNLPGRHNVLNALASIIVAMEVGVDDKAIKIALETFAGVGRRSEILGEYKTEKGNVILIDDYGHHPREVLATQKGIKSAYPNKKLVTVFQPHRYTRTRDLFEDFVHVLSQTDQLIILDVYAAGEEPIVGADTRTLCSSIRQLGKVNPIFVEHHEDVPETLYNILQDDDIVLMQGAGNIGDLAQEVARHLQSASSE